MPVNFNNLDNKSKAILFGLFLSKYDRKALKGLGFSTFTEAFRTIGGKLGFSPNTIIFHRNKFDTFFPNARKGFQFQKECGRLTDYEKWIEKTKEWSFEKFLEHLGPILGISKENDVFWTFSQEFECLSEVFDRAFERMLKNANRYLGDKPSSPESHHDNNNNDDTSNIDEDTSQYVKLLLSGFDATFEQNKNHFEEYISAARELLVFIREYWNEEHLIPSIDDTLRRYYRRYNRHWYDRWLDDVIVDLHNTQCDALSMIYTYSSVNHARNAFALFYVQGELNDLQRALVAKACRALEPFIVHHRLWLFFRYDHVHHILKAQDKDAFINLMVSPRPSHFFPLKRNIVPGNNPILNDGTRYAEFAYYYFDSHKRKARSVNNVYRYILTFKSQSNQFIINGDFSLPCNLKGYLAESENGGIILCFRGTKPTNIKNDITDLWQIFIGPETSYLCALGLLLELRDNTQPKKRIEVYGHSLGGGLSQFAVAVATAKGKPNIYAYGYNSAGLGRGTMSIIRGIMPAGKITNILHLCHKSDKISKIGYLLGNCYLVGKKVLADRVKPLPKHGIMTLISVLPRPKELISDLI